MIRTSSGGHEIANDYVRILRSRAERFRRLAEKVFDSRIAAAVAICAEELEREAKKLESRNHLGSA
jgi:hypothetical protein